ncbi:MAG: hypothetical protein P4L71_04535 [Acetobacteraceae bacterium]|nr:hypothetical protein [Acetobacteraceae bacterium]
MKTTLPKQMWDDVLMAVSPPLAAASVFALFLAAGRLRPGEAEVGR